MAKKVYYICGRCGYRAHHKMKCHNCGIMLEEECNDCFSAKGNCVCTFTVASIPGKAKKARAAAKKARKAPAAGKKQKRK